MCVQQPDTYCHLFVIVFFFLYFSFARVVFSAEQHMRLKSERRAVILLLYVYLRQDQTWQKKNKN